ncbi:MAG: thioredoxin family protein [Flavobacteriaceae bacterium]|nr:thioredoxin family protein [Flavobacteriaceae bacterium]|tara:strand:- start:7313 stop:7870 length:558 start_codon:yes stop_codon:yes gene_type:complete
MARTPSNMVPIGFKAPSFKLKDSISNCIYSSDDLFGKKCTLLMFICNHCPFVIHVNSEIVKIANDYFSKDFKVIAISSNDIKNYPQDSPELMKKTAQEQGYSFPYLYDEDQSVAKNYDAACTPDFYIFDGKRELVYRGQMDDSRPGNEIPVTGKDIRDALDSIINGKEINSNQKPSIGCNIKWIN